MNTDWYVSNLRYRERARGEHGLTDCYGLARLFLMGEADIELLLCDGEHLDDIPDSDLHSYLTAQLRQWHKVGTPQAYDLIYLMWGGQPSHIGVAVNDHELINIRQGVNVAIEPIYGDMWGRRIHSIYRHESLL